MSYDSYAKFVSTVQTEIQELDYEQQFSILSIIVNAMNQKRQERISVMPEEQKLALFNELTGSIKGIKKIDYKKEYLDYLDERYGV